MSDLFGTPTSGKPRATSGARGSEPIRTSGTSCAEVAPGKARATSGKVPVSRSASEELRAMREERDLLYLDLVQINAQRDTAKAKADQFCPAVVAAKERLTAHFEQWGPPPTPVGAAGSAPLYAALDAANRAMAPHTKLFNQLDRTQKAILARLKELNQELKT